MQLSEQEIVRRENLQKIKDLGFNPFPAEEFKLDFRSDEITTEQYQSALARSLELIRGVSTGSRLN